jgi:hypothetical protein
MKSQRELKIDNFLKQLESQEEWNIKRKNKVKQFYKLYSKELEDYIFIKNIQIYNQIEVGGYIRYINLNHELKWGGILIKKIVQNDMELMILSNSASDRIIVSFQKNYIFYKKHTTNNDKVRKLFLSVLEKYTDE